MIWQKAGPSSKNLFMTWWEIDILSRLLGVCSGCLRGEQGLGNGFLEVVSKLKPGGRAGIIQLRGSQDYKGREACPGKEDQYVQSH